MKIKINHGKVRYCLSAWLALVMLSVSFFPVPAAAQYKPLEWTTVDKPGLNNYIIVSPSEVSRIAVGNRGVVYAIDSSTNSKLYRSSNGGLSWSDITAALITAGATLPPTEIACSASDPKNVAIVTDSGQKVYFSDDNGENWSNTNVPSLGTLTIQCITISPGYQDGTVWTYDIAIGTATWGDTATTGQLLTCKIGSGWIDQQLTFGIGADISAVAFSPKFKDDKIVFAVASDSATTSTYLCIGLSHQGSPPTIWDTSRMIAPSSDGGVGTTIISSLAIPSDYDNTNINGKRKVFVSYNRQVPIGTGNGIYRFDDTVQVPFPKNNYISSIAYCTRTVNSIRYDQLIAGETGLNPPDLPFTVRVWLSSNPLDPTSPTLKQATYPPSGPKNAQVSWSTDGSVAYCATGQIPGVPLDESAFSRSEDNGDTWQQTSLMDTSIRATDIAVEPDSRSLFLATYSPVGPEGIWRTTAEPLGNFWGRILSINTASNRLILRLSPNYADDYTIYAIEAEGGQSNKLAVSHTRGNRWQNRLIPGPVADVAVADRETLYVGLTDGRVRKSLSGGMVWQEPVPTNLDTINMLTLSQDGHLFVGSKDNKIAYSTNNGTSFTEIPKSIPLAKGSAKAADVQVVTDANYKSNRIIYAATSNADEGVWRWTIGTSTEWEQVDKLITDLGKGERISGLKVGTEGTLYALRSEQVDANHTKGGMNRSLNPADPHIEAIEFDTVNRTLNQLPNPNPPPNFKPFPEFNPISPIPIYSHVMPWLKISGNASENQLWSLHPIEKIGLPDPYYDFDIYRFADNICKAGPATKPTGDIGCDPVSGRNQEVNFTWEQLSIANAYELDIGKDKDFTQMVFHVPESSMKSPIRFAPPQLMSPALVYPTGGGNLGWFGPLTCGGDAAWQVIRDVPALECGHLYYWKVRIRDETSCETVRSPWSAVKPFTIKAGFRVTTPYYGPQLLAPDNGCACPCDAPLCFSWSPFKETAKYLFELADNSEMTNPLVSRTVSTTAYQYTGRVSCSKNYFWRVRAAEPSPSEWSATFSFKTGAAPAPQPAPSLATQTPAWVWWVIATVIAVWFGIFILLVRRLNSEANEESEE